MDLIADDSDSDIEVLEPGVLKNRYRHQELKLITALSKYAEKQIPRKWEDFQIFVKNVLKFSLSPYLVRSVWVQLYACCQLANGASSCSIVEIIDEEEGEEVLKKPEDELFGNVGEVIGKGLPDSKEEKSSNEQLFEYIEINDNECDLVEKKQNEHLIRSRGNNHKGLPGNKEGNFSCQQSDFFNLIDDKGEWISKQPKEHFRNSADVIHVELKPDIQDEIPIDEQSSDYIEIINEEEDKNILRDHNRPFVNVGGAICRESKPNNEGKNFHEQSSNFIEIIDEEESKNILKQPKEHFTNTGRVIHGESQPDKKEENPINEQSPDYIEIIDEEENKKIFKQHNELFINSERVIHEETGLENKGEIFSNEHPSDLVEISDEEDAIIEVINDELKCDINAKEYNDNPSSDYIEISDEEGKDVKCCQQLMKINGILHDESKPDTIGEKSSNKQSSDYTVISNREENINQSNKTPNYFYKTIEEPKQTLAQRFSTPNGRKRNRSRRRRSLPISVEEAEAEALREKLLLDKIIELELPQVMKSFLNKNNIVNNCAKKRRKSSVKNRESINVTSPDCCKSASEIA